jgi:hypothetical protein
MEVKEEKQGPVHVVVEEQITILVENDGGLQSMLINGGLSININDQSLTQLQVCYFPSGLGPFSFFCLFQAHLPRAATFLSPRS